MNQAVVEDTNAEPTEASAEVEDAQEQSLDSILAEYEIPKEEPKPQPEVPQISSNEVEEVKQMLASHKEHELLKGLNESASIIKQAAGEKATNIPDWMIRGALREEAIQNPTIEKIFYDREADPAAWNRVASALGKKIAEDLSVDKASTDSWKAVESAVHSASTSTPPTEAMTPEKIKGLSDQDFEAYRKKAGFTR